MDHEVIYDRNLTGSYMKIATEERNGFDEKILLKEKKKGLLPMEISFYNGKPWYWYNISGKQSLDTYCRLRPAGMDLVRRIMHSVFDEIEIMEWNLLDPDNLVLDPEYVFVSNMTGEIIFTAYPGYKRRIGKQLQELMEYLLMKLDHSDPEAVRAAYAIYEKTLDEAYSLADIRELLLRDKESCRGESLREDVSAGSDAVEENRGFSAVWPGHFQGNGNSVEKYCAEENKKGLYKNKTERENNISALKINEKHKITNKIRESIEEKLHEWGVCAVFAGVAAVFSGKRERSVKKGKREKKVKADQGDELVIYPDHLPKEPVPEIHPTVCLNSYMQGARGMLQYEGGDHLDNIDLTKGPEVRIGHSSQVDARIERETVSQFHARVVCREGEYFLEDLNSTNGTYVNEEPLVYKEIRKLQTNDIVRFADVRFRFL